MAALSWINGERTVVLLYTAWILSAAPVPLLHESLTLLILSLFALFLDIFADQHDPFSQFFCTRAGATSGILLGVVTLPGLMLSRLIQMSRGLPLNEVGSSDFEYFRLQYWAASAACFGVLASLLILLRRKANGGLFVRSCSSWINFFGVCCVILYTGVRCIVICKKIHFGWSMELMLIWAVFHGSAAVNLIQNILLTFPACASIGEALLVTSGLVIYTGDMLTLTTVKIFGYFASASFPSIKYGIRSEISIIVQGMTLSLLLFPILFKIIYQILGSFKFLGIYRERGHRDMKKSMIFYVSLALMLIVVVPSWIQFIKDFHRHPLLWVLDFVLSEPLRLYICTYWVALICASVPLFYGISKNSTIERILLRKYYHIIAVFMFVPALIYEPKFLDLAFGAALAVFLILEIIRVWRIWPLGQLVHQFMNAFTDHRDSEILVISHFSLLLGCALPMWLSSGFNDRPLAPFAGILSLGIGDTMASMIGYKFGVLRWSKTGKKTVEGTGAGIICVLISCFVLHYLDNMLKGSTGYSYTENICSLLVAVTASGLLEAFTVQLDNAFIPLVFYSLLCL